MELVLQAASFGAGFEGVWAVTVRANGRVTFRFEGGNAYDVDLEDYH